jgi:hypothetical protein
MLDNENAIARRVAAADPRHAGQLRTTLSYLYLSDGPINLKAPQYRAAKQYLLPAEAVLARLLKSRTNGRSRKTYGPNCLTAARRAHYRCQICGEPDTRLLTLDHCHGRKDTSAYFLLCANCHYLKSRTYDWLGIKR